MKNEIKKNEYIRYLVFDENGQHYTTIPVKNGEVFICDTKKETTEKQRAYLNQQNRFRSLCSNVLGGFIHMIYLKDEVLFNRINIDKANIARIIYLATYIDYNDKQENLLVRRGKNNKNQPLTKVEIKKLLGLSDNAFSKFLKDVKENNLLYEVNKKFYLDNEYFCRGKVKVEQEKGYCRLFIDTIRDLYQGCTSRQHKVLSNVYELIPFMHYESNMLVEDPDVIESESVPMGLKEIGEKLNIKDNKGNLSKLVKNLEGFRVNLKGKEYKLFAYVKVDKRDFYFINPYVIYKGNNPDEIKRVADTYFFRK